MPLTNTVEHHQSSSSSHQTAVNGRWSEPKTTHSSSTHVTSNRPGESNYQPAIGGNNGSGYTSSRISSPPPFQSSSFTSPPPPLGGTSVGGASGMEDMERRSREVEQDFWNRVNESRARLGFPGSDTIGKPAATAPFTSSLGGGAPLRTSPTPPSYRSTSSASSSYNNTNSNNNTNGHHHPYTTSTTARPAFVDEPMFSSSKPFSHNNNALIAFPDNLDDMTKHSKDLAVQGIESNIEDLANGQKLMRWSFDVQGFEPHEIHVKTVGDEQLEIHGKHEEKTGNYSNYAEFSKSVSLPPNTHFDEMRSVFDTRSQRLTVEAPFRPLRQQTAAALDYKPAPASHYDSGYSGQHHFATSPAPPQTSNYGSNTRYSNIPIGLSAKQRESYRSTTSSSSSSSNKHQHQSQRNSNGHASPYINTSAIERSSSAHNRPTSRSPMGVRFEDEDRYNTQRNGGGTTIPVRYETTSVKSRAAPYTSSNTYERDNYQQQTAPPVVKTTTEYSRRIHESTSNETRPAGTYSNGGGVGDTRRVGYLQRPLSRDRTDVRVESVVGE